MKTIILLLLCTSLHAWPDENKNPGNGNQNGNGNGGNGNHYGWQDEEEPPQAPVNGFIYLLTAVGIVRAFFWLRSNQIN